MVVSGDIDDEKRFLADPEGFSVKPSVNPNFDVALFFHKVGALKLYVGMSTDNAKQLCNELYTAIQEAERNKCSLPQG